MTQPFHLEVYPNQPLIISLSFQHWQNPPQPYLLEDIVEIEQQTEQNFSKLFVYDHKNAWYTNGIDGMGDFAQSVDTLQKLLLKVQATEVHLIGESMGGFGALLLASHLSQLVEVTSVLALSPISFFSRIRATEYADRRYLASMEAANQITPSAQNDVAYMPPPHANTRINLVYGGDVPVDHLQATTFDAMHAWRIKHYFSQTQIHTASHLGLHPNSDMRQHQQLVPFLQAHLFDETIPELQMFDEMPALHM